MDCVVCNANNPEGAKYCNNCGVRLDISSGPLKDTLEASIRQEVDRALQHYIKEQKIAEFDITEKVTNRLLGWAKILGTLIGVLLLIAGYLGVKSVTDLYQLTRKELQLSADSAKKELQTSVENAKKAAEKQKEDLSTLTSEFSKLHDKYTQLNSKLPEYEQISQSASDLKARVDRISNSLSEQDQRITELGTQVQKVIARVGASDIKTIEGESAFFFESEMEIWPDGSPRAYHPDDKSGLDFLYNAGRPGNWFSLVTDNGAPSGNPVIQTANDPAPGFYISYTGLQDQSRDRTDPRRYVNSEAVNYIVLPGQQAKLGAKLGDIAVVIRPETGAHAYAVCADTGPSRRIGAGSIALANALGISSNPRQKDAGVAHGIVYIVFRGSAQGWPMAQQEIDQKGAALFSEWGGMKKAKDNFQNLTWK